MVERDLEYQKDGGLSTSAAIVHTSILVVEEPLAKEYVDSNYWKVYMYEDKTLDDLMAELEI